MNKYIHYIGILAAFLYGMTACESEPIVSVSENEYSFSLSTNSRATTDGDKPSDPGVEDLNENKLDFVYLFFFNADALVYQTEKLPVGTNNNVSFRVDNDILEETASYTVYALANRTLGGNDSPTTINGLNNLSAPDISIENRGVQSSFVMSGQAEIASLAKGNNGTITLYRSAAKISLLLDVATSITVGEGDDAITYEPVLTEGEGENTTNAMRVTLHKGNKNGRVDATADFVALEDTERTIGKKYNIAGEGKEPVYVADHTPFYSYPTAWNTEATADNECWLELMIIWKNTSTGKFAPYYYRIPVDKDAKKLLRNHHYQINANVAILGSVKPEDAIELSSTFTLESWNECALNPNLKKYSYLWVEDTDIIMNNSDEVTINFASSSSVSTPSSIIVKRKGFNVNGQDQYGKKAEQDVNVANGSSMVSVTVDNTTNKIIVDVNRKNDDDDSGKDNYRPWTITFTVTNADNISQDITITHLPAIYVVGHWNEKGNNNRFVNRQKENTNKDWNSYGVWGTNDQGYTTSNFWLGTVVNDVDNDYNTNRNLNQYKINISVLDDNKYILGDPRKSIVDNLTYLYGISNYHPTASTKDNNNDKPNINNTIAPSFLIASSWGITQPVEFEQAKRRCASYQENGYPAGRWRIPTDAEIEFVTRLSTNGYIPTLFQGNYWNSSGGTRSSNATGNNIYVRCVYDLWFWGDAAPLKGDAANTFTWGDQAY